MSTTPAKMSPENGTGWIRPSSGSTVTQNMVGSESSNGAVLIPRLDRRTVTKSTAFPTPNMRRVTDLDRLLVLVAIISPEIGFEVLRLGGIALGTLGSLTVIYPALENERIKWFIRLFSSRIKVLDEIQDDYYSTGDITDSDKCHMIEWIFRRRYGGSDLAITFPETPKRVESTENGPVLVYADGERVSTAFSESEVIDLDTDIMFRRGLQRYCRQRGMWFITIGFLILFFGELAQSATSLILLLSFQ